MKSTLFFTDQRGFHFLAAKALERAQAGDLRIVACTTQANRFVQYACNCCGDYAAARHGKWETDDELARARRRVLRYFRFSEEVAQRPQPRNPVV